MIINRGFLISFSLTVCYPILCMENYKEARTKLKVLLSKYSSGENQKRNNELVSTIKQLITQISNTNITDNNGTITPLLFAAQENDYSLVKLLLESKANPNKTDFSGTPPIMYTSNVEIIKLLVDNKADLHLKNDYGSSALDWALESNNQKLINLLQYYSTKMEK